jgi:hypothetical protein
VEEKIKRELERRLEEAKKKIAEAEATKKRRAEEALRLKLLAEGNNGL